MLGALQKPSVIFGNLQKLSDIFGNWGNVEIENLTHLTLEKLANICMCYTELLTLNLEIAQFLAKASSADPSPERKSNEVTVPY